MEKSHALSSTQRLLLNALIKKNNIEGGLSVYDEAAILRCANNQSDTQEQQKEEDRGNF